jgi:ubiquinone/menaquinone biosynthesis C-methylase UbiE
MADETPPRSADQSKRSAQRWFDRRAGSYEGGLTARWRDPLQRASLDALELTAADRLLDVGCGTGWASRTAALTTAPVVGIDLSAEMLTKAVELAAGIDGVSFALADSEHLPFPDASFSAVLCSNSFHHYPDPGSAVSEMVRVLQPGGRLVLGDATSDTVATRTADRLLRRFEPGHVRMHTSEELGGYLRSAGLAHVQIKRMQRGGQAIARGRRDPRSRSGR